MSIEKPEKELVWAGEGYRIVPVGHTGTPAQTVAMEQEENGVPLSHYLWVFRRHRWKMAAP